MNEELEFDKIDPRILKECLEIIYNEAVEQKIFEGIEDEDTYVVNENKGFTQRGNVVTKTKEARMNWLKMRSALAMAKSKNDPIYRKLCKFSKLRRQYIDLLTRKYAAGANKKAKELIRQYKSNSGNVFDKTPAKNHIKTK